MCEKKRKTKRKKLNWDLRFATPDSAIFGFVNHRININQSTDVVKWTTPVKALRDEYKKYFDLHCKPSEIFVHVSEFNLLMERLGVKQMPKYISLFDESTKKHSTKKMRCWVGCRLIFS